MKKELRVVAPYGDTPGDGAVQMSFTLPVPVGDEARHAALILAGKMGFQDSKVVFMEGIDEAFTFFVVYGRTRESVDFASIRVHKVEYEAMEPEEIHRFIQERIGRKIVVLGACIGSDAHTVGIDAILNMKGYDMHKGLESYPGIRALNLGAQVPCEVLVARAREEKADALLVSQVVTQRNSHLENLTRLIEILEADGMSEDLVLVVGGPRITPELAKELGYDAGFGPGTLPEQVASYLVQEMVRRRNTGG